MMLDLRLLTLEEAVRPHNGYGYRLLQLRWEPLPLVVTFGYERLPWLIFFGYKGQKHMILTLKGEEYGKIWRCFDLRSNRIDANLLPWDDGEGMWTPEEEPEAEEE